MYRIVPSSPGKWKERQSVDDVDDRLDIFGSNFSRDVVSLIIECKMQ